MILVDIITVTKSTCENLMAGITCSPWAAITKNKKKVESNITKEEEKVIETLMKDHSIMIILADIGKCTVILDKEEYKRSCMKLLDNTKTYEKLKRDRTKKFKVELLA